MSQKFEKLKTLLKELFQLDQPDLDFGLYRIMHAKSAEVTQFLDKDLLPQVQQAFGLYKTAVVAQQIYLRFVRGHSKDARFAMMIVGVRALADQAERVIAGEA